MFKSLVLTLFVLLPCIFAETLPENCAQAARKCNISGIYQIQPRPQGKVIFNPLYVYCELDRNGGDAWTLLERRLNGTVDFNRYWEDYKHGFGTLNAEFWLGLENIHALANDSPQELWVHGKGKDGFIYNGLYTKFAIGNEDQHYQLSIVGDYIGNTGNAFGKGRGLKFSTLGTYNEAGAENCLKFRLRGWWYKHCIEGSADDLLTLYSYSHVAIWSKHCRC